MQYSFEESTAKEYLLTNGIGGYSAASVSGANTRRYHGLIIASFNPPTQRLVMVSKMEETIITENGSIQLSTNQFPGAVSPLGYMYIDSFEADVDEAKWVYKGDDFLLKKTIRLIQGANSVIVSYTNLHEKPLGLQLLPLLVYRDYHALFRQEDRFNFYTETIADNYLKVYAEYGANPLFIKISKGEWQHENVWYKNFEYIREKDRGFDFTEDACNIGKLTAALESNEEVQIIFSGEEITDEINFHKPVKETFNPALPSFVNDLVNSSRQFVVQRKSTGDKTIIAGYHWFTDWGRDTMIALRGISIATGKQEEAKSILNTFFNVLSEGMLPNRFPDYENDEVEYNTIDATLWLFISMYEYYKKFNDADFIKEHLHSLKEIIDWHIKGTSFNIKVTPEGLLYGGESGYQLTWMDARIGNFVVTPRIGCPVEINALWYNALCIYQYFSNEILGEKKTGYDALRIKSGQSFQQYFINTNKYLNDVVIPGYYFDYSIRPNQIYAASLPFSPLTKEQQQNVLSCVEENLLTAYGLRTLDVSNPQFKPAYKGDAWQRDTSYHQGTVWPFLWAEWAVAFLKLNEWSKEACVRVWNHARQLREHFYNEGCMHAIAEIFDGLKPNAGKGCVQQAWSAGGMLSVFLHPLFKWDNININD